MIRHSVRRIQRVTPNARRCILNTSSRVYSSWRVNPESPSQSPPPSPYSSVIEEENFGKHAYFVLDVAKRFFKISLIGLFALSSSVAIGYEGAHFWVETVGMAPETDEDVKKWEWELLLDNWIQVREGGGTDPALGFKGRHIVRAAWMTLNWMNRNEATGGARAISIQDDKEEHGFKYVNASLQRAEQFLRAAIAQVEAKKYNLDPTTFAELLARHGTLLEKLGSEHLSEAKSEYEKAWTILGRGGSVAAYLAEKAGDISSRMGEIDDALLWWTRAIQLAQGRPIEQTKDIASFVPEKIPVSPLAQRVVSNVLVSLSSQLAQSGQLKQAEIFEEKALNYLRSIPSPSSFAAASGPQALHALYLLQRSSLLSIHLAEVKYALRRRGTAPVSVQHLASAAESSERVSRALSDGNKVRSQYGTSQSTSEAAVKLLRDARRTAAEAWNLMGVLYETQDGIGSNKALECYRHAVEWAGAPTDEPGTIKAAEGILEEEWNAFQGNYNRAVLRQSKK